MEEWKDIIGFCNQARKWQYQVSSFGRVRKHTSDGYFEVRQRPTSQGYTCVSIRAETATKNRDILVHHLVLTAFISQRPPGLLALHKDDDKTNNHVSNLIWGTHQQNSDDFKRNKGTLSTKPRTRFVYTLVQ